MFDLETSSECESTIDVYKVINIQTSVSRELICNDFVLCFRRVIEKIDQTEFEGFEYVNPLLMSLEDCV